MAANPSELSEVLDDLKRHLAWQEGDGGPALLADVEALNAARALKAAAQLNVLNRAPESTARPPGTARPLAADSQQADRPTTARPVATESRAAPAATPLRLSSARPLATEAPLRATAEAAAQPVPAAKSRGPARTVADLQKVASYSEADRRPMDEIKRELGDCTRCKLCKGRKQIVFGVGNPRAKLVFVGEGPGADEDAQGVPFVGAAGQLLTKMIEAMGFTRDEVYICNVVKCRPPDNRTPEIDEIEACEPFLRAQLGALQPEVIVALGKTALQTLLREEAPITKVRGSWREYAGIPVMPTFHPSYLLRKPEEKKNSWSDLQQVMKRFGKEPKRS